MLQIDRFKKRLSCKKKQELVKNKSEECSASHHAHTSRHLLEEVTPGTASRILYPAIAERYPTGTRVLWSEVLTGPGALAMAHPNIFADSINFSSPTGSIHPATLLALDKVSSDSKSIAIKSVSGLVTVFPVQSGFEKFKTGSCVDAKEMKKTYFKVPAPRFPHHKRSPVPNSLLLDLNRPLSARSTVPSTLVTFSGHKVDTFSSTVSESGPVSEDLSIIAAVEEISLSDELQVPPTFPNAYTTYSTVATDSTQIETTITQNIDISENSTEKDIILVHEGAGFPPLQPIQPIDPAENINHHEFQMIDSINEKNNPFETKPQGDSCIILALGCISNSTEDQEVPKTVAPKVSEQPTISTIVTQIQKIHSLDDLVKDEYLAWGSGEESNSKDSIVISNAVEKHLFVEEITPVSSSNKDIINRSSLKDRESINTNQGREESNIVRLLGVESCTVPNSGASLGEHTLSNSIPDKHIAINEDRNLEQSSAIIDNTNLNLPSEDTLSLSEPNKTAKLPMSQSDSLNEIKAEFASTLEDSHIPIVVTQPDPSHSTVSQSTTDAPREPKWVPPHLRPLPQALRSNPPQPPSTVLPHLKPPHPSQASICESIGSVFQVKLAGTTLVTPEKGPEDQGIPSFTHDSEGLLSRSGLSRSQSAETLSTTSSNSASEFTTSLGRPRSAATESSDDCTNMRNKPGNSSESSLSSGSINTPKEPDVELPTIAKASISPYKAFTIHPPPNAAPLSVVQAEIQEHPVMINCKSKRFLKTEKGHIELPIVYTSCDDKKCSFLKNRHPCKRSHAKVPRVYIPYDDPICSELIRYGSCPTSGKSCLHGAHPCSSEIRFNGCYKRGCPLDHSITINPSGEAYSILLGEPQRIPRINKLNSFTINKDSRTSYNLEPPGLSTKLGPRSNNDWDDFTRINILPTLDEIISSRPIFLPRKSSITSPHDVFDIGFRYQREAELGQVRLALSHLVAKMLKCEGLVTGSKDGEDPVYRVYNTCTVTHGFVEKCRIPVLNFGLRFSAPASEQITNDTVLRSGHLLALLSQSKEDISLVWLQGTENWSNRDEHGMISNIGRINVKMASDLTQKEDLETILTLQSKQGTCLLVDFGGVLPATFVNVLAAIQKLDGNNHLGFARNLFQNVIPQTMFHIPHYLQDREVDFSSLGFDYRCRFGSGRAEQELLTAIRKELSQKSSDGIVFTMGQMNALINSFTSRLSFIQGPPGTGKSFIGRSIIKMLAVNRRAWKKDKTVPILLTAQTNHALDETIAGYIKSGLKVARLGVNYSTQIPKPEHIAHQNHVLPREVSDPIRRAYSHARKESEASSKELEFLIGELTNPSVAWNRLGPFLQKEHPDFYTAFLKLSSGGREGDGYISWSSDEKQTQQASLLAGLKSSIPEGFQGSGLKIKELEIIPQSSSCTDENDDHLDVYKFPLSARQDLIRGWKKTLDATLNNSIELARARLQQSNRDMEINSAKETAAKIIGFGIDVVACTSTRAANDMELLKHLKIEVAIVEEAGEIVEPMVLPIFGSALQQLIMIGDHQQLKPFCNTPALSGGYYQHDQSLFERLVNPAAGIPSAVPLALLDCQRRMRPEIAGLVRSLDIYKTFIDGDNVQSYPDVPGMGGKNLLWLDHNSPETFTRKSYHNEHEAKMIAGYAAHLIRSGEFGIRDIVILTPYREQVSKIEKSLQKQGAFSLVIPAEDIACLVERNREYTPPPDSEPEDFALINVNISDTVLVTTIDNYQGQEANVIIYSAVRSNNTGRLGFTDITNRACVTLSRARHGMYIFGNAHTAQNSKHSWNKVVGYMKAHGMIVQDLPVQKCSRHTGPAHLIRCPTDWEKLHLRKCDCLCSERLPCGHRCSQSCHSPSTHSLFTFKCIEPTNAVLTCGHTANFPCGARETHCPACKVSSPAKNTPLPDTNHNNYQSTEINIFPLHISELLSDTATPTVFSHETWFLDFSRFFLCNADGLEHGRLNGVPSREVFLRGLNLSENGLKDNKWAVAQRYEKFQTFHEMYRFGLNQALILERTFDTTGLVSRMEGVKKSLNDKMTHDIDCIVAELMKLSRPHNSAVKYAAIVRQAFHEFFAG